MQMTGSHSSGLGTWSLDGEAASLALRTWASYLPSQSLSFHICVRGRRTGVPQKGVVGRKGMDTGQVPASVQHREGIQSTPAFDYYYYKA